MSIMQQALESPAIAGPSGAGIRVERKPAKLAFREVLLGINVPDLHQ